LQASYSEQGTSTRGGRRPSGQCCKQGIDGGIIAESFASVREPVDIARPEDKTTSQLERISAEFVLRVSGRFGAGASLSIIASQQVKQVCVLELHGRIGFALFVNEQRKGDTRFVAKSARIDAIPKPHCGQGRSAVSESLVVRAQLRDVLAAENSAIVPQENYHRRLADPQRTKAEFLTVCVRQSNHGKAAT